MLVKNYAAIFVLFTVLIASGLALINYVVDPYMLFQSNRVLGLNDKKPASATRSALFKPYNVIHIKPKTIIVGNSRPEMGINPNSTCWPSENGTVYSLTFPGLRTYPQVRALFHAVAAGQVENILLGVDFADFLYQRKASKKEFWPKRTSEYFNRLVVDELFQENDNYHFNKLKDFSMGLFSLDALNDSVFTLMSQSSNGANRTVLGFNPAQDYNEIVRYEGSWVLFKQNKKKMKKRFSKPEQSIYDAEIKWSIEFESIKRTIELALEKNIKLIIFINPYHHSYLEAIRNAGYWNEFELFKKGLADTVKQYGNEKVTLWDFALYSNYTVSAEPKENDKSQLMPWFWEPAHYKEKLGDVMLSDIFTQSCIKNKSEAVGVNITNTNIDEHLINQQTKRTLLLDDITLKRL